MKFGYRKPSPKRSFSARTTGRIKRSVKRSVNPLYGKKGMGYINNPKKAVYNKVYNKTTTSVFNNSSTSNLSSLTVAELKEILRSNNLKVSGRKQELIDRITENIPAYSDTDVQDDSNINIHLYDNIFKDDEPDVKFEPYVNKTDKSTIGCVMFAAIIYMSPLIMGAIIFFLIGWNGIASIITIIIAIILLILYFTVKNAE